MQLASEIRHIKIGIIGGSGLDNPDILKNSNDIVYKTPYGEPSSLLKTGKINETDIVLIARHGRQHTLPPEPGQLPGKYLCTKGNRVYSYFSYHYLWQFARKN